MRILLCSAVALVLLFSGQEVRAGGDIGYSKGSYYAGPFCRFVEDADELVSYVSVRDLKAEVYRRYEHATVVARSDLAIYSQSPLFVWASEAKVACAKSYGYLRKRRKWRKRPDYVMLQKCECFYERMIAYGGGRY